MLPLFKRYVPYPSIAFSNKFVAASLIWCTLLSALDSQTSLQSVTLIVVMVSFEGRNARGFALVLSRHGAEDL